MLFGALSTEYPGDPGFSSIKNYGVKIPEKNITGNMVMIHNCECLVYSFDLRMTTNSREIRWMGRYEFISLSTLSSEKPFETCIEYIKLGLFFYE